MLKRMEKLFPGSPASGSRDDFPEEWEEEGYEDEDDWLDEILAEEEEDEWLLDEDDFIDELEGAEGVISGEMGDTDSQAYVYCRKCKYGRSHREDPQRF